MFSSIFIIRRLNPNKTLIPLIIHSISTKPTSNPLSRPQQNHQNHDPETVHETLSCYTNDWKSALDFFNWVEKECKFNHTTDTYNRIIDILGKFFEFDKITELIERMPCSIPNHTTYRILFKRYASAHLVNSAIHAYDSSERFSLKDETSFCNLIDALCEYKHVIEAQELYFKSRSNEIGVTNRTKIYNMILRGWFKMGWWSKCREFWEEMDRDRVCKDLHSYSIYMDILCKGGKPWKAVKLYKEMKGKGMKLDVVAYNIAIRAIGLSQGVDFAVRVYRDMRELGCVPNVATYNTIVKLFCENGRFKEAYKVLDEMNKKGVTADVITYHCFFGYLEKPKEILFLFDRMIENDVRPRMDTYVMLMRKFGRWGFLRPVLLVWKKMEEQGCSPGEFAYKALIDVLIQKNMLDLARKYEEEMLERGLSAKPRPELKELEGG
ncbi:pentatricopeptide repeat-containing protein At1g80550, mitochondrial [Mercurialis annua]|uniref:pentatricopeptide repeat-containing protein At1g80550, mitochondrial n=1 Tax=Mercurialis annua TaxID=3986 RepID=UPI00215F6ECC|nr:pentatricopeptide repeat-containing protein At1g80550, mitochondrial [Mercurialis annua]